MNMGHMAASWMCMEQNSRLMTATGITINTKFARQKRGSNTNQKLSAYLSFYYPSFPSKVFTFHKLLRNRIPTCANVPFNFLITQSTLSNRFNEVFQVFISFFFPHGWEILRPRSLRQKHEPYCGFTLWVTRNHYV